VNPDELKNILREVIEERDRVYDDIDRQTHTDHHKWVAMKQQKEQRRNEFCESVKQDLSKWGIKGTIAIMIAVIWYAFQKYTGHL